MVYIETGRTVIIKIESREPIFEIIVLEPVLIICPKVNSLNGDLLARIEYATVIIRQITTIIKLVIKKYEFASVTPEALAKSFE